MAKCLRSQDDGVVGRSLKDTPEGVGLAGIINVVNRSVSTDSKLSLDATAALCHRSSMATYTFRLYCQRIDATKNMARYYALSMQPTLFGETAVVRYWGRIGKRGGAKSEVFSTDKDAVRHFLELVER